MAKFLYVLSTETDTQDRIWVKDETFKYPDGVKFFPLKQFTTDDLLKVKAQIATELENRMDYDDVVEQNLEKLKTAIRSAKGEEVAKLILQTLDRVAQVASDEKRAKTRLEILKDEMKYRLEQDGESKKEFRGIITATYESKTVYNVGEEGWGPIYAHIVADAVGQQFNQGEIKDHIAREMDFDWINDDIKAEVAEIVETVRQKIRTEAMVSDTDLSEKFALLDEVENLLGGVKIEIDRHDIADDVGDMVVENLRRGLKNAEAFELLQKRLKSTTFDELGKQGEPLPDGIQVNLVRDVKFKRNKK